MKEGDIIRVLKINKATTFLIGVMMMTILLCYSSQVQAAQDEDYNYTVLNGQTKIATGSTTAGYTGAGGDVTIPNTLGGAPVTSIGVTAFLKSNLSIPSNPSYGAKVTIAGGSTSWPNGWFVISTSTPFHKFFPTTYLETTIK
jgi:hypothetical protein